MWFSPDGITKHSLIASEHQRLFGNLAGVLRNVAGKNGEVVKMRIFSHAHFHGRSYYYVAYPREPH